MKRIRSYAFIAVNAAALALSACGGGGSSSAPPAATTPPPASTPTAFVNNALLANTPAGTVDVLPANTVAQGDSNMFTFPQTENTSEDPNLSQPWGIAFAPGDAVWVNDFSSNMSSLYDGNGNIIPSTIQPPVAIPPDAKGIDSGPTGIVANIVTTDCPTVAATTCVFGTGFNAGAGAAQFIFDGTGGTISAWATGTTAITEFDGSANGDSFTGLAIYTQSSGSTYLLAADFHNGVVDVFDSNFQPNTTAFTGGFKDPNLPAGYAPFGIQTIGNLVYISYAEPPTGSETGFAVLGEGLGMVDVFDGTGTLMTELIAVGGALNAPWGMAVAPQGFGSYGGDLLVGNFGDGRINVFDPTSGAMLGTLMDSSTGAPIHIPGLWGIAFGNGDTSLNQSATTLYYAASPDMKLQGLYGSISTSTSTTTTNPAPY